jgi:copper resistance protein B
MSRASIVLTVICAASSVALAQAAEDHSAHRPAADPHAGHRSDAPEHTEHSAEAHNVHDQPTESELRHVPPPPPQHVMGAMSNERMIELMQMEDDARVGMVLIDQVERREIEQAHAIVWDAQAWYGDDYNKAWFKAEGERLRGEYEGRTELLWDRVVSRWWSLQSGLRHDFGDGPSRTWVAFGMQGLAPYWFEIDATVYVGEAGRTAARAEAEFEILLTQR